MKREIIVIGILVMLGMTGIATAAEGDLGITFDTTWVSKYIWRGIDRTDDKAAIQPSVNFDLGSGLSAKVWASYGCAANTQNANEYDYSMTYSGVLNEGIETEVAYALSYIYYDFIDMPSAAGDAQEINLSVALPNICPAGVVPSYTIVKMWGAESNSTANGISGWIHVIGLDYALTLDGFIENNPEQVVDLSADFTYNGSAGLPGAAGKAVDHDWSHITLGASTGIALPEGAGTITPGIYYQISMDDSVNTENELYSGISYTLSF